MEKHSHRSKFMEIFDNHAQQAKKQAQQPSRNKEAKNSQNRSDE